MIGPGLLSETVRVAAELSHEGAVALASALEGTGSALEAHPGVGTLATARQRELAQTSLAKWAASSGVTGDELASALVAAQVAVETERNRQHVDLVWSGPRPEGSLIRRTDAALFEVVESASERLLLVTYAAYDVPLLVERLREAAADGIEITLILESPTSEGGKVGFDPLRALQSGVPDAKVFRWPPGQRPTDPAGRSGSLHAKCAVADDWLAFVSSANLTGDALDANMELGLLVEGAEVARRITEHFAALIDSGHLQLAS